MNAITSAVRVEQIGNATLYLADCGFILPATEDVDLCLTDPPYGISLQTNNAGRSKRPYTKVGDVARMVRTEEHKFDPVIGDTLPLDPTELLRFKNAILWGANNYANRLPVSHCWLCWDKKCGKASDSDIGDCELAWVRGLQYKTVRCFRHMWAGFQRDSQVGEKRLHPTEKPIALMEWCLQFFPTAQTVFDPFMGSGTTGVACAKLGRSFIGVEIDSLYFDVACRRIADAQRQSDLFVVSLPPAEDPADTRMADLFREPEV